MKKTILKLGLVLPILAMFEARAAFFIQEHLESDDFLDSVALLVPHEQVAAVLASTSADTSPREISTQHASLDSQATARAHAILAEALRETRANKDRTERMQGLLTVFPLLKNIDPATADSVLEEARLLAPKLPEGPSIWSIMGRAALEGAIIGVAQNLGGGQSYLFPEGSFGRVVETSTLYSAHSQDYEAETRHARTVKHVLTLQTIEWLAAEKPEVALELARAVKDDYSRFAATGRALRSWPVEQSEFLVANVRNLVSATQKEKPDAALLAIAAITIAPYDSALARELTHRALREMGMHPIPLVYEALAMTDTAAAKRLLHELLRTPSLANDRLKAFALGVDQIDPELAWQALQGMTERKDEYQRALLEFARDTGKLRPELAWQALLAVDKSNMKFLAGRGSIFRRLAPALPPERNAEAQDNAVELLAIPSYKPGGMKLSYKGTLRDEFRKLSAVSDVLTYLGQCDPDLALAEADQVIFSEFLAQTYILERSGFLKKVSPMHSRIDPSDKPTKENLERTYFRDLAKVELALSWQQSNHRTALAILDSLDNTFWMALVYTALRQVFPPFDPIEEPDPAGLHSRLRRLLWQVKSQWPALALANTKMEPPSTSNTPYRFVEVSELMDRMAVAIFKDEKNWRQAWLGYLPFASAHAGRALYEKAPELANKLLQTSLTIAAELPSPAQEWARCWNAALWKETTLPLSAEESEKAVQSIAALNKHEPWHLSVPLLAYQVATLNPDAALKITQRLEEGFVRVQAQVAVASALLD